VFQHLSLEVGEEPVFIEEMDALGEELLIAADDWLGVGGRTEEGWSVVWQEVDWNLYEIYGIGGDWALAVVAVGPIQYGTLVNHVFWNRRLNTWHVSEPICTLGTWQSTTIGTIYSHRSEDGWHEVTAWALEY